MKQLIIIGGANGTGKTTFAIPYVKEKKYAFLNADEIAKKLEDLVEAKRIFGKISLNWSTNGIYFIMETKDFK